MGPGTGAVRPTRPVSGSTPGGETSVFRCDEDQHRGGSCPIFAPCLPRPRFDVSLFGWRHHAEPAVLPIERRLPGSDGATRLAQLAAGHTGRPRREGRPRRLLDISCVHWLRTLGYLRARAEVYTDRRLVVVGVHSPEFPFEHDIAKVRRAADDLRVAYPIALDNDFAVWHAFGNRWTPRAGSGTITSARADTPSASGRSSTCCTRPAPKASPKASSASRIRTYLGYEQARSFGPPGGAKLAQQPHFYPSADSLRLNERVLIGAWRVEKRQAC